MVPMPVVSRSTQRQPAFTPMRRQQGAVLIVSLVLLLIITAIAASTLTSSTFQTVVSNNAQKRDTVFHVAESATERVLPMSPAVTDSARKAKTAGYKPTLATSDHEQPGVATPTAKIIYPGDQDGKRPAYLKGTSFGSGVQYVIRNYEIQGDAQTTDGKVKTKVVAGVAKVETEIE